MHRRVVALVLLLAALVASPAVVAPAGVEAAHDARYGSAERLAFHLVNCMRTGGKVLRDGTCKGYGSGNYSNYRKPLRYSHAISDRVSRPYAVKLAKANACRHDLGTANGGVRLKRAGFEGDWGENIGCTSGTVRELVVRLHLMYQSEKGTSGWHWRNIKRRDLNKVGIGVARVDGVPRLVEDFLGP